MGRGVSYLNRAHTIVYYDVSWMGMEQVSTCPKCGEDYYHPYEDESEPDTVECCGETLVYSDEYREGHDDWTWFIEDLTDQFIAKYPSLEPCDNWEGNEDHIFLENELIEVGVAEYCGLASVSMRAKNSNEFWDCPGKLNFANRMESYVGVWVDKTLGDYNRVGGFSDGTSVYEKKEIK